MFKGFLVPTARTWELGCNGSRRTQREERKRRSDPPLLPTSLWNNAETIPLRSSGQRQTSFSPPSYSSFSQDLVPPPSAVWVTPPQRFECKQALIFKRPHRFAIQAGPINSWVSATWHSSNTACHNHCCWECSKAPASARPIKRVYCLNNTHTHTDRHVWRQEGLMDGIHPN